MKDCDAGITPIDRCGAARPQCGAMIDSAAISVLPR
jgi:hypothetical protein